MRARTPLAITAKPPPEGQAQIAALPLGRSGTRPPPPPRHARLARRPALRAVPVAARAPLKPWRRTGRRRYGPFAGDRRPRRGLSTMDGGPSRNRTIRLLRPNSNLLIRYGWLGCPQLGPENFFLQNQPNRFQALSQSAAQPAWILPNLSIVTPLQSVAHRSSRSASTAFITETIAPAKTSTPGSNLLVPTPAQLFINVRRSASARLASCQLKGR